MQSGKRKKTNAREIKDEEWTEIKARLVKIRERLIHLQVNGAMKSENDEIMESYVMQCEKAMKTGKREDLPKIIQMKLAEQKREKAIAKATSPLKAAETAAPTPSVMTASTSISTMAVASVQEG